MPWSKHHRKEKFASLDKRRRPQRRKYFKEYMRRYNSNEIEKQKNRVRALTRLRYGQAKKCSICGSTDRVTFHHYTEPYEIDKFIEVCEYHHIILDFTKRYKK